MFLLPVWALPLTWPLFLRELSPLMIWSLGSHSLLVWASSSGPLLEGIRAQEESDCSLSTPLSQVSKANFHSVLGHPQDARDGEQWPDPKAWQASGDKWGVKTAVTGCSRRHHHFAFCSHGHAPSSQGCTVEESLRLSSWGSAPASFLQAVTGEAMGRGSPTLPWKGALSSLPPSSLL